MQDGIASKPQLDQAHDTRFMLGALEASAGTLRAYDLKAQIGMVAFAVVTNTIAHLVDVSVFWQRFPTLIYALVLLFLLVLVAHLSILFPRVIVDSAATADPPRRNVFFIRASEFKNAADYLAAVRAADQPSEMAQQLLNLARIRETKHRRTVQAIVLSAVFYAAVAALAALR